MALRVIKLASRNLFTSQPRVTVRAAPPGHIVHHKHTFINYLFNTTGSAQSSTQNHNTNTMGTIQKSEDEWRAILTPKQFKIIREKGTEPAGTGEYNKHKEEGK